MKKTKIIGSALVAAAWLVLTLCCWFSPAKEISETERRKLEQLPAVSADTVFAGSFMGKFERYTQDQFPLREVFRTVKSVFNRNVLLQGDNNGIYLTDGYAAQLEYPLNISSVQGAVKKFQKIHDLYLGDSNRIVFSVVPDKGYYLAEKNGYPAMDYDRLFAAMKGLDWAEYVDITDCLTEQDYYYTDTHWRQERLDRVAEKICKALNAAPGNGYVSEALERDFYGVYYGQAALPMKPETMYIRRSALLDGCIVTNLENGGVTGVYDLDKLTSRDLYDVFLSGPVSLMTIENPAAQTDRELLVFRDSFGSSLVPLLISDYSKVTLIDTRYLPADLLGQYVTFGNQDVLMLYSTLVLNNSAMLR